MRIAFADFLKMDFHAQSVDCAPLGGTQSAACYLARALAKLGHEVYLISHVSKPGVYDGVGCLNWDATDFGKLRSLGLDAFICIMAPQYAGQIRPALDSRTRFILWNHHNAEQPAVQALRENSVRGAYDGFAMVSQWLHGAYQRAFGLDPARCVVLHNAVAPAFETLFPADAAILPRKEVPPILAYTSAPYRGLELLLDCFPRISAAVPGTRLKVYSSMKPYQESSDREESQYGALYRRCREIDGVEYVGSIPQPQLAAELSGVSMLAYPSTFAESHSVAVLEAMAAGCRIVTTDYAGLPETCSGFARLIQPTRNRQAFLDAFVQQAIEVLQECAARTADCKALLRRQVDYSNASNTWAKRAPEWIEWIETLTNMVP